MKRFNWKKILVDPRFWLLIVFVIRLIGITNPPLEVAHNWRQVTTNMYARNFLEIDNNILYARVDHAGSLTGITAKEFPLYNYLIYILSFIFGFQHWYGRLISLIFGSIGIYFFYLIILKYIKKDLAFPASMLLLFSSWFMFSRKIMPDVFSMSLVIIGIYFCLEYFYKKGGYNLILYFLFAGFGVLSKLPSVYLLAALIVPFLDKRVPIQKKIYFASFSFTIIVSVYLWYFKWIPYIVETYGFEHFPMRSLRQRSAELLGHLNFVAERYYFTAFMSFTSFLFFCLGLFIIIKEKTKSLIFIVVLPTLVFIYFMMATGVNFYHHSYYIVPFVPVMALVASVSISKIKKPMFQVLIFGIIILESISNQHHDFIIKDNQRYISDLERIADKISNKQDLFAVNSGPNPEQLYFCHRKGWAIIDSNLFKQEQIENLKQENCRFVIVDKHYYFQNLKFEPIGLKKVFENEHFIALKFLKN